MNAVETVAILVGGPLHSSCVPLSQDTDVVVRRYHDYECVYEFRDLTNLWPSDPYIRTLYRLTPTARLYRYTGRG